MKILNKKVDLDRFWKDLSCSDSSILFLDYDGTLAPFTVERDEALPYPWVPGLLNEIIKKTISRLVIISGRDVTVVQKLLHMDNPVEIWGCHGRQHLFQNGEMESEILPRADRKVLSNAHEWIEDHGLSDNMEEKSGCIALHFRGMKASRAGPLEKQASRAFEAMLPGSGMALEKFDGGIEIRSSNTDKGKAVEKVLSEYEAVPPCAYLGDDLTDEDAFKAIKGKGLGILVREDFRPTMADVWIKPPEELKMFLTQWRDNARRKRQ